MLLLNVACICGGAIDMRLSGRAAAAVKEKTAKRFWEKHSGEGHSPCEPDVAASVRAGKMRTAMVTVSIGKVERD